MEYQFYIVSPLFIAAAMRRAFHDTDTEKYRGWMVFAALLLLSVLIRVVILFIADPNFEHWITQDFDGNLAKRPATFVYFYSKVRPFLSLPALCCPLKPVSPCCLGP